MKKLITSKRMITMVVMIGILLGFSQTALGQDLTKKVDSLAGLIESQNRIAVALEKIINQRKPQIETQESSVRAMAALSGVQIQDCVAELNAMPEEGSLTYNPMEGWDVSVFAMATRPNTNSEWVREYFTDFNGDGLSDYIYIKTRTGYHESCVYVNNGTKMEEENICRARYYNDQWIYYGDCAG